MVLLSGLRQGKRLSDLIEHLGLLIVGFLVAVTGSHHSGHQVSPFGLLAHETLVQEAEQGLEVLVVVVIQVTGDPQRRLEVDVEPNHFVGAREDARLLCSAHQSLVQVVANHALDRIQTDQLGLADGQDLLKIIVFDRIIQLFEEFLDNLTLGASITQRVAFEEVTRHEDLPGSISKEAALIH